jgi:hypothetical protein
LWQAYNKGNGPESINRGKQSLESAKSWRELIDSITKDSIWEGIQNSKLQQDLSLSHQNASASIADQLTNDINNLLSK